jgi:cell division protein FtsQ
MKKFRRSPGAFLAVLLLGLLTYLLGWSHLLSLKTIVIHGVKAQSNIQSSLQTVKPPIYIGEPLARIDVRATSRAIKQNEWISKVDVGRSWIHGSLTIYVEERKPVASYLNDLGELRYFDADGRDFSSPLTYPNIPTIKLRTHDIPTKRAISNLLHLMPQDLLNEVQSFTVNGSDDVETHVAIDQKRQALIKWGSPNDISLKVEIYKKLLGLKENAKAVLFDLSNPLSPITK